MTDDIVLTPAKILEFPSLSDFTRFFCCLTVTNAGLSPKNKHLGGLSVESDLPCPVMDQWSRHITGFAVQAGDVDGVALCRMFNTAIAGQGIPHHLGSDNDPLFRYHQWRANLRILEIEEIKSIPYTPQSHPFIERLIGTIRREYLDHTLFWNAQDLERKLVQFKHYYNQNRPHQSLDGEIPAGVGGDHQFTTAKLDNYAWQSHCGGLL